MYPSGFDRANAESPFLNFVAREFNERGTQRRRELAQKIISHPFVADLGLRVPQRLAVLDDIQDLRSAELPETFVLKPASGWSSRGVMLLERHGDDYFDHMGLLGHSIESIAESQSGTSAPPTSKADRRWIVEELVQPSIGVGVIPFDYKFYCFDGEVALITQTDRNTGPTKVVLFDGQFKPLRLGTDYLFAGKAKPGVPIVPLHAPEMLWWAQKLSSVADSPFVRIDLFDSPTGPVFGEFTYSPGGTHNRTYVFSHTLIDQFDEYITSTSPLADPLLDTPLGVRNSLVHPAPHHFRAWAGYAYNGGPRGAERLASFYREQALASEPDGTDAEWYRRMSGRWAAIRDGLWSDNRRSVTVVRPAKKSALKVRA